MRKEFESGLKRSLKRKIKITMGLIVSFMIMGNIGYSSPVEVQSGDNNGTDFIISSPKDNGDYTFTSSEDTSIDITGYGGFNVRGDEGKINLTFNGNTIFTSSNVNKYIGAALKLDSRIGNTYLNINGNNKNLSIIDENNSIAAGISSISGDEQYESSLKIENINDLKIDLNKAGSLGININKGTGTITANNNIYINAKRSAIDVSDALVSLKGKNIYLNSGDGYTDTIVSSEGSEVNIIAEKQITVDSNKNQGRALEAIYGSEINLTGQSIKLTGKNAIFSGNDSGEDNNIEKINKINLKADSYEIYGDIIALRENSKIDILDKSAEIKGNNKIAFNEEQIINYKANGIVNDNYIRVISVNNSNINLDLSGENSILIGRLDDYTGFETIKRNEKLDDRNTKYEAFSSGQIDLKLDENGIWVAKGNSYLTSLNIKNSYIDLSTDKTANLIHTNKIEGNGTFALNIDTTENRNGSMIYIKEADNISENNIEIKNINLENFDLGE